MVWLVVVLLILLSLPLVVAAYILMRLHHQRDRNYRDEYFTSPYEAGIKYEEIGFVAADGVGLRGWLMKRRGNRFIIGCHGHHGKKSDLIGIGSGLYRKGFNVLLFDMRHCGQSDNARQSVAYYEQRDLQAAITWVKQHYPRAQIGIIGFSMGGAVALMSPEDEQVKAVVSDCAFANIEFILRHGIRAWGLSFLAPFLLAVTFFLNRQIMGYSLGEVSPLNALRRAGKRAYFFIHGAQDSVIAASHSRLMHEHCASPHKKLWIEEGQHCGLYFKDRDVYIKTVADFFNKYLK